MTKAQWSGMFPSESTEMAGLYRTQQARCPTHATSYDSNMKALEEITKLIGVKIGSSFSK
ncbi:MAG: hypothetical protein J0I79_33040 [Mesorhizobium sp.]|uniref:hypothetical protein n=1 Tax=Mesorhizobium sp. TaxID=1871066 RepID=UPI001ACB156B|nr:hypothetical protein [Mesorhizobium sp.]MBN9222783.1 hypothetical protein [Mesorhizobium sp.]